LRPFNFHISIPIRSRFTLRIIENNNKQYNIEDEKPKRILFSLKSLQNARILYDFNSLSEKKLEFGFKESEIIEFVNTEADENGRLRNHIRGGNGR
jgi:hypothetical protein